MQMLLPVRCQSRVCLSGRCSRCESLLCLVGVPGISVTRSPFSIFVRTYRALYVTSSSGGSPCTRSEVTYKFIFCSGLRRTRWKELETFSICDFYFLNRTFWRRRPVLFPVLEIPCYSELPVLPVDGRFRDHTQHCFPLKQLHWSFTCSLHQPFR